MKIRAVGAKLFNTDCHDEVDTPFSQFLCTRPEAYKGRGGIAALILRLRPAWQRPACTRFHVRAGDWRFCVLRESYQLVTMASLTVCNLFLLEKSALKFDGSGVGRQS